MSETSELRERLLAWGQNSPDPDFFGGDVLGMVLSDCSEANARIEALEAEVGRLKEALEDISKQSLVRELSSDEYTDANFEDGFDGCVLRARAALAEAIPSPTGRTELWAT